MLESFVFATVMCGFFGIILKKNLMIKNLMMKIVSMNAIGTGVIAYYGPIASRDVLLTPIIGNAKNNASYANPVLQVRSLTGIAIGFSIQALKLVGVMKLARDNLTLESNDIEKNTTP